MIDIGFIASSERIAPAAGDDTAGAARLKDLRFCPRCSQPALVFQEGCHTCRACGWSKCS